MRKTGPSAKDSVPDPTALTGNEAAKSRVTRKRILEAARDLLNEDGYNRFSTSAVAERALLTRPAMLYHFGSRMELLTAVVQFLARRRIEMFEDDMGKVPVVSSFRGQAGRSAALDVIWTQLEAPEFGAFAELVMAARTNKELKLVVEPALAAFDRARRETSEQVLPNGSYDPDDFQLARDVVRAVSDSMLLRNGIVDDHAARIAALKHFLHMLVATTAGDTFLRAVVADRRSSGSIAVEVTSAADAAPTAEISPPG